jgi:autotransporter-associated beta strand protein
MESLEERSLLTAGLAKFDFNNGVSDVGPSNGWTKLLATNAAAVTADQFGSGIAIQFTSAPTSSDATAYSATPSTIPSDASGIRGGFLVNGSTMSFVLKNLDRQKLYEVWILGGNVSGSSQSQHTTVQGLQGSTSFDATILDKNLWVNSSVGTSSKIISAFTPILATPLVADFDGDQVVDTYLSISVTPNTTSAELAGVVIQELPSSFTLPGTGGPFSLTIQNGNRVVKDNAGNVLTFLANSGAITINGTDGANDTLNVDLTAANPMSGGLTFNGGTGGDDRLTITGGSQGTVTYNYTNAHDGSVVMSNFGTINYTGLEPITNSGTASDVVFNLPAGLNGAALGDDGTVGNSLSRLSGATFEMTDFTNPSGSVTINPGSAADAMTVHAAPDLNAALTIGAAANPFSTVSFGGNLTLATGKNLAAFASGSIGVSAGIAVATSGSGSINLTTATSIGLAPGSSLSTASGPISLSANQQATASSGNFTGIDISGGIVNSTSGDITLAGRGGNSSGSQIGVHVSLSGAVGQATTGKVTVTGRGGDAIAGGDNIGVWVDSGTITASGNIQVAGTGGSGNFGENDGVIVSGKINASGAGTLQVVGIAAGASGGDPSAGIAVGSGVDVLKTVTGKMILNGTGDTGVDLEGIITAGADIEVTGMATTSGGTGILVNNNLNTFGAGNIKLIADSMDLEATVSAENRAVTLIPQTADRSINLGGADTATQLGLTDLETDAIAAGTINIGDANSGPVTISSNITRDPSAPAAINLTSGGTINFPSGGGLVNTAGGNLTLTPGSSAKAIFGKAGTDVNVDSANTHGTLSFAAGADLAFAINGTTADSTYDVLNVTGNIDLSGTDPVIQNPGSFIPSAGDSFAIVQYTGSRGTGTFSSSSVLLNNVTLNVVYDDANKRVLLVAPGAGTLSATLAGGNLTIADVDATGKDNNLTIGTSSGNLLISDANEAFISAPAGGTLSNANKTLTIPLSSVSSLTINGAGGNDSITTSAAAAFTAALTINGGTGNDTINLNSSMSLAADNSLNVDLQDDDAAPGVDVINVGSGAVISLSGNGAATLRASKNIAFAAGSGLITTNGAIIVEANQQATPTSGDFVGVLVSGAGILSNGSGNITVKGQGGTAATGGQFGVRVESAGGISGGTTGTLLVQGTGGAAGGDNNSGISVNGTDSLVSSNGADVTLIGAGGSGDAFNRGVVLFAGGQVTAGGLGKLIVQGTGGAGSVSASQGVLADGNGSIFFSSGGDVFITGTGGGSGSSTSNGGVVTVNNGAIQALGSGKVQITGTAGNSSTSSNGVSITTSTLVTSSGGDITITGIPVNTAAPGVNITGSILPGSGGKVQIIADRISIDVGGSISAGTQSVTLTQKTAGRTINLGGADSASDLGLADDELDRITAGTINIGDANSGSITVSAAINRTTGSTTAIKLTTGGNNSIAFSGSNALDAQNGNVTLLTNSAGAGSITSGSSSTAVTAANLSLTAGSGGIGTSANPFHFIAASIDTTTGGNGNQFLGTDNSPTTIDPAGLAAGTGTIELDGPNPLVLGGSDRVTDSTKLSINGGSFAISTFNETVAGLTLASGSITGTTGVLTSGSTIQSQSGSVSAKLAGTNGLAQSTTGTTTLSGANTYSGPTAVNGGTLLVNGSITSNVAVVSGGTLGGSGTINSANTLTINSGGHLAPGTSPGILNSGNISLTSGSNFDVELNGTTVGTQYDQDNVTGAVSLGGATLNLALGFSPAVGNTFTIINNDLADAVSGAFNGLPQGAVFTQTTGSFTGTFQISYQGGSGNDVVLKTVAVAAPSLDGTSANDTWLVKRNGANDDVTLNGNVILSTPVSSLTSLTINGLAGSDTLTIDSSAGDPFPSGGITYHGGNNSGDKLIITGGSFTTITNNYTSTGPGHSGNIVFVGSQTDTVTYDGLAPIDMTGSTAANLVFNLPATASTAFLGDDGIGSNGISQISSTGSFETTTFSNPTSLLTINRGNASDTVTVNPLPDFNAGLTIGSAASPLSAVTFAGGVTLAADKSLSAFAGGTSATNINFSTTNSDLAVSGTGQVTLTAARDILFAAGSSISTVNGDVTLSANQQTPATAGNFVGINLNGATIQSSGTGKISLLGRGGDQSSSSQHYGVWIQNGAHVSSTATGASAGTITISGTGGSASGDSAGVRLGQVSGTDSSDIAAVDGNLAITGVATSSLGTFEDGIRELSGVGIHVTGTGSLTMTGAAGNTAGGTAGLALRLASSNVVGTSITAPQISLIGDRISIDTSGASPISISASSSATLRPNSANTPIDVGSATDLAATPTLELSNIELARITTPTINIGNASSGAINVTGSITRAPATTNFNLTSGGSINFIASPTTGSINTDGGNLVLTPGGSGSVGVPNPNTDVTVSGGTGGTLSFGSGSKLAIPINGATPGAGGYDQLRVSGNVDLTGANLVLSGSYTPQSTDLPYTIVTHALGIGTTTGTFNGLPESKVVSTVLGGTTANFQITYKGGGGNDVVLTALDNANPVLQGTSSNDTWLVKRNGANVDVTLNGTVIWSPVFASLTSLSINGLAGADTLTVDSSAGDPFPSGGIVFHGGGQSGDKLITTGVPGGGSYTTITNNYTSTGPGHSGNIVFVGSQTDTLNYDGLAPIDISGSTAANLVFNLPAIIASLNNAFLEDDGTTGNGKAQLRSGNGAFETTVFKNPSGSVTINPGSNLDTITINALQSTDFNAGLTIGAAGSEFSTVTFAGALTLAANKSLSANALGTISLPNIGSDLAVSGSGAVSLTTARNISLGNDSSISSVDGAITLSANQQAVPTSGTFVGVDINNTSILPSIQATGSGLITIAGKAGDAAGNSQYGVHVEGDIKGGTAGVQITGFGGGSGNSPSGIGVFVEGSTTISAAGAGGISVAGTGGSSSAVSNYGVFALGGSITSAGGDIQVTGRGGGSGNSAGAVGVFVQGGQITAGGTGSITVQGFSGPGTGITSYGVSLLGGLISSSGPVQVTGAEGSSASSYAISVNGGTISSSTALTLVGDSVSVGGITPSLSGGTTGSVSVHPLTNGNAIDLGSTTDTAGSGTLALSDIELDAITAGTINLGDTNSGPITVSAAINRAAGSTTAINLTTATNNSIAFAGSGSLDAKTGNVTLLTNSSGTGAITSGTAAIDLSGANVSLTAGSGGIGASGNPLVVTATNFNATTGGNGNQFLSASGSTTIDGGGLSAGTGTIEFDGGTFALGGPNRIDSSSIIDVRTATLALGTNNQTVGGVRMFSGGGSITGPGTLTSKSTIQALSGTISAVLAGFDNTVGLIKDTPGTVILSGANIYSGDTTIAMGTLGLGADDVIPDGPGKGNVVVGGAVLDMRGFSDTINGLSNSGAGNGIIISSSASTTSVLTIGNNDQTSTFSGAIEERLATFSVRKIGTGTLTLSGANTYDGDTTISDGTLKLGAANVIPDGPGNGNVILESGTLDLGGFSETVNGLSGGGRITSTVSGAPSTLSVGGNDASSTFSGLIADSAGAVAIAKIGAGTLTLTGATKTYSGDTTISQGALKLGAQDLIPSGTGKGNLVFNPASGTATLDVAGFSEGINGLTSSGAGSSVIDNTGGGTPFLTVGRNDQTSTFGGSVKNTTGSLVLLKTGTGTLTLTGSSTNSRMDVPLGTLLVDGSAPDIRVNGGTLGGTGTVGSINVTNSGRLAPGDNGPGVLNSGDVLFGFGSFNVDLNGPSLGAQYDQQNVTGTVSLAGTPLDMALGYSPAAGDKFTIVNNDSNDPISGGFLGAPEGLIFSLSTGSSKADFQLTYKGGDGNDVVLTAVNVAPTLGPIANQTIAEDAPQQTINLTGISAGGTPPQTISITAISDKPGIIPNPTITYTSPNSTGTLKFQPIADQSGLVTITVTVQDDGGTAAGSDTFIQTFTVNVTEVNDSPVANPDVATVAEDSTTNSIDVLSNDSPGPNESTQTLTVTAASALHGSVTINPDGTLSYRPSADYNGPDTISYSITDNGTTNGAADPLTADGTVAVTVTEVNDAPTAVNDALPTVAEDSGDGLIAFSTLLSNDLKGPANENGQALSITSLSNVVGGTAVIFGENVQFTPAEGFNGTFSFAYSIADNGTTNGVNDFKTATGTASFTVTEINDPPTGVDDALSSILEDAGPQTIAFATLLANDITGPANESGQSLTITAVDSPIGGTVDIVGTDVIFTPASDFNGTASFVYTVVDDGTTNGQPDPKLSTGTVSFTIDAVNDAPFFVNGGNQTASDEDPVTRGPAAETVVSGWATSIAAGPTSAIDEAGQALSFTVATDNDGLFAVKPAVDPATGDLMYTIAPNANGTAHVSVVLSDDGGTANGGVDASAAQVFDIVVTKPHIWHSTKLWSNGTAGLDVTGDNHVAANDVVAIVNYLNGFGSFLNGQVPALGQQLPNNGGSAAVGGPFGYLDVNGDGFVAPNDAVAVVNVINANQGGEGETAVSNLGSASADVDLFTLLAVDVASQGKRRGT